MKKITSLFILVAFLFIMNGCYQHYTGDNPDLYTVAVNSLLWNSGHSVLTERHCDSEIEILEQDSYGRVLFSYTEKNFSSGEIAFSSLLISQKTEGNCVYYYPDYNFISLEKDPYSNQKVEFPKDEIETLKDINDWEQKIDLEKCVKKEISNRKSNVPLNNEQLKEVLSHYKTYKNQETFYFTSDDYGRFMCYSNVLIEDKWEHIVFLIHPDFTYDLKTCFYIPSSYYNYQDELKAFKELNHWNEPIS